MTQSNQHLVLIDGYGFLFRAFHACPPLKRQDGTHVGAIYGFTSMITKILLEFTCSHLAVVLDSGGKTFRHEIYADYKSHRPPAPEELIPQFPLVRDVVSALNISTLEKKGFEADDLIATFAKLASNNGIKVTIVSSDKDLMQLIDDNISMYDPVKAKYIYADQVEEKFNVKPKQVIEVLALIGDSADFVPGVPGIGPKTAAELINQFHSLEGIYSNLDNIAKSKRKESLIENKDLAFLSRELVILDDQVETTLNLEDLRIKAPHAEQFKKFLDEQSFNSLYARADKICRAFYNKNEEHHNSVHNGKIRELTNIDELKDWTASKIHKTGQLSIVFEAGILCLASDNQEVVICKISGAPSSSLFPNKTAFTMENLGKTLLPFLNDLAVNKIIHDVKRFYHLLEIDLNPGAWQADDLQLMSYVLNNGVHAHDLKTLVTTYFTLEPDLELDQWLAYTALLMLQLTSNFKLRLIQEKLLVFYERVEKPLSKTLYQIEKIGIKINPQRLQEISTDFTNRSSILEQEIFQLAGSEFNLASPKQLSEVLFKNLGLQASNNKSLSTNAEVLEELSAQGHKIAELILSWRHLVKLISTYTNSLINSMDKNSRIHTNFQMTITSTGRLSSINPNLQNIPIRSEDGLKIRSAFIAEEGYSLISADYSQVELRLLAHMADIPSLKQAFLNKQDIHAITASEVFKVALADVTPELRRRAKAINFGIIYGISAFGLANQLKIARGDASKYIEAYFQHYPGIKQHIEKTKEFARKNGFVETLLGRRCYIKNINDSNQALRSFSERAAVNAPLQGTSADIIKKAMITLNEELSKSNLQARTVLQIHDELLLEVKNQHIEEVSKLTKKIMESVISLSVPLIVDVTSGKNWAEI